MTVLSNARSRGLIVALTLFVAALATLMLSSTHATATPGSGSAPSAVSAPASAPGSDAGTSAVPYPPTAPSATSVPSTSSSSGVAGVQNNRPAQNTNTETGPTANTGFQTLTASIIAGILLIGGGVLLLLGRRRSHA